jgi:fluoroquinolone transport system permease protein
MTINFTRIYTCIKADIFFQLKHGFYTVYLVLSCVYIAFLLFLPQPTIAYVLPVMVYLDPSALGLFFIGGMILLEKQQGILSLVYITPLLVLEYVISKLITLGLISVLAGVLITLACGYAHVNYLLLVSAILLTSVFYTGLGFIFVSTVTSVNEYLVKMILPMMLLFVPCASIIPSSFLPSWSQYVFDLIPSVAGLKLIFSAYLPLDALQTAICFLSLIVFNIVVIKKVIQVFTHKVVAKGGFING